MPDHNLYFPGNTFQYSENVLINYEVFGDGPTPILFLHGFGASLNSWNDIKNFFPLDKFKLFLIDLKGFGFSSKPKDNEYTIENQAKIISAFIEKNNLHNVVVIGHSYGGGVGILLQLELTKQGKELIDKLILIDGAAYINDLPFFIKILRIPILNRLSFLSSSRYRAIYTLKRLFFDREKITEEKINRYATFFSEQNSHYSFVKAAKQIVPNKYDSLTNEYKNIKIPVQIIWGKNDPIIPMETASKLNLIFPKSRLEIISDCGHIPQEECPEQTYKIIDKFLNNH